MATVNEKLQIKYIKTLIKGCSISKIGGERDNQDGVGREGGGCVGVMTIQKSWGWGGWKGYFSIQNAGDGRVIKGKEKMSSELGL